MTFDGPRGWQQNEVFARARAEAIGGAVTQLPNGTYGVVTTPADGVLNLAPGTTIVWTAA